ncbi:MAG: hypothetical protein LBN10_03360 [Propionibacteriaceae bacterium]|jgi:hypothetical protein|nr:hypothetical protein [Propionibacteriaceae bacterium]
MNTEILIEELKDAVTQCANLRLQLAIERASGTANQPTPMAAADSPHPDDPAIASCTKHRGMTADIICPDCGLPWCHNHKDCSCGHSLHE